MGFQERPLDRRQALGLALGGALAASFTAKALAAAGPAPSRASVIADMIAAGRILSDQGVLDGFGHVSARNPEAPNRVLISRSMAAGLMTPADIFEIGLDGEPIAQNVPPMHTERYIHSAIYAARPDVQSVVHSHSAGAIPFSVSKTPLRPVSHMAGFLSPKVPIFEIRDYAGPDSDLLVRDGKLGAALAKTLGKNTVVLMRGHGFVAVGDSVRTATMHAVYTEMNAREQSEALRLGGVTYLSDGEASKITAVNDALVNKSWDLWYKKAYGQ